jgi:16S rRNA (cytosine967-C5)-methyltransferase
LLIHAAASVKPGGKLIYSVCTLARAETSSMAETFSRQADFQPLLIDNPLISASPKSNELLLLPHEFGGNGMYIAAWTRT